MDELQRQNILDQTLLILTADHGEQFGEHGDFGHGMSLYEPEVHVPLLVSFPVGCRAGGSSTRPSAFATYPPPWST